MISFEAYKKLKAVPIDELEWEEKKMIEGFEKKHGKLPVKEGGGK